MGTKKIHLLNVKQYLIFFIFHQSKIHFYTWERPESINFIEMHEEKGQEARGETRQF